MKRFEGLAVPIPQGDMTPEDRQGILCSQAMCHGVKCMNCLLWDENIEAFKRWEEAKDE